MLRLPRLLDSIALLARFRCGHVGGWRMKVLRGIATELGRGLIAGFVGAVAMTIASTLEMKLRKRPPSSAPADAAGKVLGIRPRDEEGKRRFSNLVHYAYGSAWGLGRATIRA